MAGRIPAALRARLEDEATFGLIELLESERRDWSEQVFGMASDRFERRLAQELGLLRTDVSKALNDGLTAIRQETATARIEMLKWSFVFWIGQVAAIAGLLAFMRR
jgi:2',3'-cyclic-nucleotide 2'-phosphodiesterase (5'-nucleotidase family)